MPISTNLPPRHSDGRFASLGSYGAWEQVGDLNALASALRVGTDTIRADDIKSIPDAWAQIQVFQQALLEPPPTEPSHPSSKLHDDVRSQWRGLLALIALQPEFKHVYDLHVTPLTLSDLEGPGRRLRRVLRDLEPKQTLVEDPHSWNNLGILYSSLGQWPKAVENFEKSDILRREIGYLPGRAINLKNLAELRLSIGDHAQAEKDLETSVALVTPRELLGRLQSGS